MYPSGASVAGFGQQPWAAFTAVPLPTAVANAQQLHLGSVESNGMLLGTLSPEYLRLAQNTPQSSSLLSGSPVLPTSGSYGLHQTVGYALQAPVESGLTGRQLPAVNLPHSYPFQHFNQHGHVPQSLPLSNTSLQYGQSFPYLQPILPSLCNGGLNHLQQCASLHPQSQTGLVTTPEACVHKFDSVRHFGALSQDQSRRSKPMITSRTNLYISGLNESDTDETVRCLVKDVVQPKSCKAMVSNGICKGYGFIDCSTEEDAEKAKNHIVEYAKTSGRKLLVKFAHENEKDMYNVYVRHLPLDFTKEKLEELFRKFGQITSVKLLENEDRLTGIGFVRFALAEQADKAIEQMNAEKLILGDNTAPVMCKLADKANTRRRAITSAHNTTALMFQNQLSLNSQFPRQSIQLTNPASFQRGALSLAQPQSNPFLQSFSLATPLLPQLNQPHVIVQNVQTPAVSHTRGVISSGLLQNGTSGSAPMIPVSFPTIPPGTLNPSCPVVSNRATPLIGPPPQTQISSNQISHNNVTTMYSAPSDVGHSISKISVSLPSRIPGVSICPSFVYVDSGVPEHSSAGSDLSTGVHLCPSSALHYTSSFSHSQPSNYPNSQLMILAQSTVGCTFPTGSIISSHPGVSFAQSQHGFQQIDALKTPPPQPTNVAYRQSGRPGTVEVVAPVRVITNELQAISLKPSSAPECFPILDSQLNPTWNTCISASHESNDAVNIRSTSGHSSNCFKVMTSIEEHNMTTIAACPLTAEKPVISTPEVDSGKLTPDGSIVANVPLTSASTYPAVVSTLGLDVSLLVSASSISADGLNPVSATDKQRNGISPVDEDDLTGVNDNPRNNCDAIMDVDPPSSMSDASCDRKHEQSQPIHRRKPLQTDSLATENNRISDANDAPLTLVPPATSSPLHS